MPEAIRNPSGGRVVSEQVSCNIDFGNGHSLELDYVKADGPWLSNGTGIKSGDVWFEGETGLPDLRIHIQRVPDGIAILIDRGQQSEVWWPAEAPPHLKITFDRVAGTATATASVGTGDEFQEVMLGRTVV